MLSKEQVDGISRTSHLQCHFFALHAHSMKMGRVFKTIDFKQICPQWNDLPSLTSADMLERRDAPTSIWVHRCHS